MKYLFSLIVIFLFTKCSIVISPMLPNTYKYVRPKKVKLVWKDSTEFYNKNHSNYIYYCSTDDNNYSNNYFYFLPNNISYFDYRILYPENNNQSPFKITKNELVEKEGVIEKDVEYKYYKNREGWGFYQIKNDSLYIQYFRFVGTISPSFIRVSELYGKVLSDSTFIIEREVFLKPIDAFKNITEVSEFNPPKKFVRFDASYIPNQQRSWLYKTLWFKKFIKKNS